MCGLHGILTVKAESNADDFLASAFVAGSLRGKDSSGIATIALGSGDYEIQKLPVNGTFFCEDRVAMRLMREAGYAKGLAICHTRHATIGGVSMDTAHPFECYDDEGRVLIGAHNGTLTNWKTKKGASQYEVDSEWALNHILAEKLDAFEDFTGAYCFTWWDTDNEELFNIARNKERPMFVVMLKSGGMAYASEAGMLYWLLERHNVEMDGPITELLPGYLYQFPIENPKEFKKVSLPAPKYTTYDYHGTGSRGSTTTHTRQYKSEVEKVQELLDKVASAASSQPDKDNVSTTNNVVPLLPRPRTVPKSPSVTDDEHEAAQALGILGDKAVFIPMTNYGMTVDGLADVIGTENEAEVRGWNGGEIPDDDVQWHCTVIGAMDDGTNIKMILSTPTMRERAKTTVH